jgi:hypothetical protein
VTLLVDEDLASHEMISRLNGLLPGRILETVRGMTDAEVWARAQAQGAAVLTANTVDFLRIAEIEPDHHGLLLVYRANDRTKDLRVVDIAARVGSIVELHPDGLRSMKLVVNHFSSKGSKVAD